MTFVRVVFVASLALVAACDLGDVTVGGQTLTDAGGGDAAAQRMAFDALTFKGRCANAGLACHAVNNMIQGPQLGDFDSFLSNNNTFAGRFTATKGANNPVITKKMLLNGGTLHPVANPDAVEYLTPAEETEWTNFVAMFP